MALDEEMSENERRALVRNIRQRGTEGYALAEQQARPTIDYTAAAKEMFAGDPVVLNPAQTAGLESGLEGVSQDAQRYAEAQRAIFEGGQQRELEYGHGYYDAMPTYIGAQQGQLDRYDRQLTEQAARAAAARRSGGGGGSVTPRTPSAPGSAPESDGDMPAWWDTMTEGQQNSLIETVQSRPQESAAFDAEADAFFQTALDQDMSFAQARSRAYRWLTTDLNLSPAEATALLTPYIATWESVFAGQEVTYDPAAGMGPGISGPYLPSTTTGTRGGSPSFQIPVL